MWEFIEWPVVKGKVIIIVILSH